MGLKGLPGSALPPLLPSLKAGWWIVPPFVLLLILILYIQMSVNLAALYTLGALILVSWFRKEGKIGFKSVIESFEGAARSVLMIICIGALAGIFVGALSVSGLGMNLSQGLVTISGGNQVVLLILTAFAAIILGMGLPVIAVYIMLVLLIAPALIQTGITPLAAHFFVFFYAVLSFITPPVAVCAYVAASIAGASPFRIGFQAMRLSIVILVIPFAFVYNSAILMDGTPLEIIISFVTCGLGTYVLAIALEGFLFQPVSWFWRILFAVAGCGLITNIPIMEIGGFILGCIGVLWEWRKSRVTGTLPQKNIVP
jgi:TRAP transporter 4TM/12TM fusion protein